MRMRCATFASVLLLSSAGYAGTIETIAGTGERANNGSLGTATEINISQPFGVEFDDEGNFYFTEVGNHRVWQVDLATGKMHVVAGTGKKGYSGDGGPATKADLNEPYEVRFDQAGNMFFVEMQNHLIRKVDAKTGLISTVAGTGKRGFAGDGGPATKAEFHRPHSIDLDPQGNIYVADIGNHRIRKIDAKTGVIETISGTGERQLPQSGELAKGRPIFGPRALFCDGNTLWIALREGNSIWKLNLETGIITHVAGTGKKGFTGDGGDGLKATFNGPKGIAIGPNGNIFVADTENQVVRKIDIQSNRIETIAGKGPQHRGYEGDNGEATKASLNRHHGICVGEDNAVYIGDTENHAVRRINP